MIIAALMFVFGAWCVQQLAQLPSIYWLLCALAVLLTIFLSQYHPRFSRYLYRRTLSKSFLYRCLAGLAAFILGFCWASGFALLRMGDELPHAWEQKNIQVVGVVASVPELTARGVRFKFDVEKIVTKNAVVPQHISLNQYGAYQSFGNKSSQNPTAEAPSKVLSQFKTGERWQLLVRLKRPHGTANPHGFDFELWALSENIRAMGTIKSHTENKKLSNFVWRPSYVIEHLRENIKARIAHVLNGKPYLGIIQALVMGDDSQINVDDWQVFLRTGISHLVSISGLHITMLAGLAFGFVSFIWRRSPSLMMRLPTRKAAVIAGTLTALAYALIAGFAVPSQRT
jgi:competence protein ComEC